MSMVDAILQLEQLSSPSAWTRGKFIPTTHAYSCKLASPINMLAVNLTLAVA